MSHRCRWLIFCQTAVLLACHIGCERQPEKPLLKIETPKTKIEVHRPPTAESPRGSEDEGVRKL